MINTVRKFKIVSELTGQYCLVDSVKCSSDLFNSFQCIHEKFGNDHQEHFYIFFLNRANKITGFYLLSIGGITSTVVDVRLILRAALLADCCNIAICHNHPSGNIEPSKSDLEVTDKIKRAAQFFDLRLIDHIILGEDKYYSFADNGIV